MEFYAQLRESMAAGNSAKGIKHPTVENSEAILKKIDESTDAGKEKERLVIAVYTLTNIYKNKLHIARSKNLRSYVSQAVSAKNVKIVNDDKISRMKASKVDKFECIPESILPSKSKQMKLAVAIFLSTKLADSVKKDLVLAILNDSEKTCEDVADLFADPRQSIAQVRKYIQECGRAVLTKAIEKYILCALIELSELFKDKMYSKLGMDLNAQRYIDLSIKYLESYIIHTIAPFEPAITTYIKHSIALCSQEDERKIIYNQYRTSPLETMNAVISGLPDPKKRSISRVSDKSRVFNPEETYQCHKGPLGYTRDIVATYYKTGPKMYKILTYSDCLYDVLGCTTETVDHNGEVHRTEELFDKLTWIDRLKLLPEYRAKVVINTVSGAELNSYTGESSDITVSWLNDEGYSCSKTYIMKKPKDLKIKVEEHEE